jgi:hypothetical protein
MNANAALHNYVEDELLRAPLLVEEVVEATLGALCGRGKGSGERERGPQGILAEKLRARRQLVVNAYVASLREQAHGELTGRAAQAADPAQAPAERSAELGFSLVGDDEVAIDIEMSHTIEAIKSVAEYELRELLSFTSALVGDMSVASDSNPLRAETHARALWAAAQALSPDARELQIGFMRHAGKVLATVVRKAFAGACARLEAAGIEPAAYRTLILPAGARSRRGFDTTFIPDWASVRREPPAPDSPEPALGLWEGTGLSATTPAPRRGSEASGPPVDSRLVDLLTRLFDAILSNRRLPPDIQGLVSSLQPCALRITLRDPMALDDYEHPAWQLMDRLAFLAQTLPPAGDPERTHVLGLAAGLVENVASQAAPKPELFRWTLQRLDALELHRLERRCDDAAERIAELQRYEDRLALASVDADASAPVSTFAGTLDLPQLDTVPSRLLDEAESERATDESADDRWLAERRPGDWLRLFLQGRWVQAQLLWPGERGELWLLADTTSSATWAVRRRAFTTLRSAHLLETMKPRSLVREAAQQLARQSQRTTAAAAAR